MWERLIGVSLRISAKRGKRREDPESLFLREEQHDVDELEQPGHQVHEDRKQEGPKLQKVFDGDAI